MAFALERGKQVAADRGVREYGDAIGGSLFEQITSIPLTTSTVAADTVTVERPEGTYVVENLQVVDGVASAMVTVRDEDGVLQGTFDILSLTVSDENRIDYEADVQTTDSNWVETGSLVGVSTVDHTALQLISINGGETSMNLLDFGGMTTDAATASGSCPVTTTPFGNPGGAASAGTIASACALLAVGVVIFLVAVVCIMFCWMLFQ